MLSGTPSRTAKAAAAHRAAHQVLEQGRLFADPLALRILGDDAETAVREAEADPSKRRMRIFIAARTRFAEDALAAAVQRGVRQLVVLGAGLDTFAYRSPHGDRLSLFEVDHPATQAWKRQRLADAAIPVPDSLVFAPIAPEASERRTGIMFKACPLGFALQTWTDHCAACIDGQYVESESLCDDGLLDRSLSFGGGHAPCSS
jgi:hypothetical protein